MQLALCVVSGLLFFGRDQIVAAARKGDGNEVAFSQSKPQGDLPHWGTVLSEEIQYLFGRGINFLDLIA